MKWIDRAEARFGHLAIPHLMRYVAALVALSYVLYKVNPAFIRVIDLDPGRIMAGEVWRLFTYIFIPQWGPFIPEGIGAAFYIFYLWWIGDGVEHAMGSFKLNVFYLLGMIGTTIAAFFFGSNFSGAMLNSSLFFAFARFYPDAMIYLFYILPVKVKWMAWVSAALILLSFLTNGWSYRCAVLVALGNYILFFGREILLEARHRSDVAARRQRFEKAVTVPDDFALHRCEACGRTEHSSPDLEFRVAKNGHEYCVEHLPKAAPVQP
jgi:membrane associated rhomboid family serine protease